MTTQSATKSSSRSGGANWTAYASQFGALGVLIIICIIFAILEPAFISPVNIFNVLRQVSMVGNDLKLDPGVGTCGKNGQGVPVGVGQPHLRMNQMTVGGTRAAKTPAPGTGTKRRCTTRN